MKRILCILTLAMALLVLAGCSCKHEWVEANCTQAKSCLLCGQREGSALGHQWTEASCTSPKTCTVCGKTEGSALAHSWVAATCARPETCSVCGITKDIALEHSWVDATCTKPRTCTLCDMTDGSPNGHSWKAATCTTAKTCNICAVTDGGPLGHSWTKASCTDPRKCLSCGIQNSTALGHEWLDATCEEPVRCAYCDTTQGDPLGHSWIDATPEAPKTCAVCALTEGDPVYVDDRFISEDCAPLFGSWRYEVTYTAEDLGVPGFDGKYTEYITYIFGQYGELTILTEVEDPAAFKAILAAEMAADYYAAQAEEGRDAAAADEYWRNTFGLTIPEYAAKLVEETISDEELNLTDKGVYYVADDLLHTSPYWEDDFTPLTFTIEEDILTITNEISGVSIILTRYEVSENTNIEEENHET